MSLRVTPIPTDGDISAEDRVRALCNMVTLSGDGESAGDVSGVTSSPHCTEVRSS
jgi:hypothetical protein